MLGVAITVDPGEKTILSLLHVHTIQVTHPQHKVMIQSELVEIRMHCWLTEHDIDTGLHHCLKHLQKQ